MKPALLDVNVLIALIDPAHEFHDTAHEWFGCQRRHGWATCPITENGCIRIMSSPGYPYPGLEAARIRDILVGLTQLEGHRFWADSVSLLDSARFGLTGAKARHLTDIYLPGLARGSGGRLATFDASIRWQSVAGCGPADIEPLKRG